MFREQYINLTLNEVMWIHLFSYPENCLYVNSFDRIAKEKSRGKRWSINHLPVRVFVAASTDFDITTLSSTSDLY